MAVADLSPASEIAPELKMSRERVVRAVQSGKIAGQWDEDSGWLVSRASARAFVRKQKQD